MIRTRPSSYFLAACLAAAAAIGALGAPRPAQAAYAPKVAIVMCKDSYDTAQFKTGVHMSSQGLVGLAGLVGAPYETIMLSELVERPVGRYNSVWFSTCALLRDERLAPLASYLSAHLAQGGSVLMDGPIGAYAPPPAGVMEAPFRGSDAFDEILNVRALGWENVLGYTVRTAGGSHPLSGRPGWAANTTLTQGLGEGADMVGIHAAGAGAHTWLQVTNGSQAFPWLVSTRPGAGRVLAISTYANDAGAATPFRNEMPAGFFDNQLLPRLIDAALWLLSPDEPAVGLQLSHAPLTVVIRLDADQSNEPAATEATLDYLVKLGRSTGVATAYAIVSSLAQQSSWAGFLPLLPEIEKLGGAIGSHSHTHKYQMSQELTGSQWDVEIPQSMELIRNQFTTSSFKPAVAYFINPGNEIDPGDYKRFFRHLKAFFTHGFETAVPYSSGVLGFDLDAGTEPVATFNNTPVPDFAWLYDMMWNYTPAQATAHQKNILEWYQNRIGRGALYNHMWHDYALANSPPLLHPTETNLRPFFDVSRDHFARERIYAPAIYEAAAKLRIASHARFSASSAGGAVTTTLDLSRLSADDRPHLAGMGLRLNGVGKPIIGVTVDGAAHPAFTADTVILPPTRAASLTIVALTGDGAAATPRLVYLSKAASALTGGADSVSAQLVGAGLHTRFCFVLPPRHVVLGADEYAPASGGETCGSIEYGSAATGFEARTLTGPQAVSVTASQRRITAARVEGATLVLDVAAGAGSDKITFTASEAPTAVMVGSGTSSAPSSGGAYVVTLGGGSATSVRLTFRADPMPDAAPPVDSGAGGAMGMGGAGGAGGMGAGGAGGGEPGTGGAGGEMGSGGTGAGGEGGQGGAELDGAPAEDAASEDATPLDAASPDGARDGAGRDAGPVMGGDDGCGCDVGGARAPGGAGPAALGLFALVLGWRARRRR